MLRESSVWSVTAKDRLTQNGHVGLMERHVLGEWICVERQTGRILSKTIECDKMIYDGLPVEESLKQNRRLSGGNRRRSHPSSLLWFSFVRKKCVPLYRYEKPPPSASARSGRTGTGALGGGIAITINARPSTSPLTNSTGGARNTVRSLCRCVITAISMFEIELASGAFRPDLRRTSPFDAATDHEL
jgi:hypothetical protein